jgi:hypothetical protein
MQFLIHRDDGWKDQLAISRRRLNAGRHRRGEGRGGRDDLRDVRVVV